MLVCGGVHPSPPGRARGGSSSGSTDAWANHIHQPPDISAKLVHLRKHLHQATRDALAKNLESVLGESARGFESPILRALKGP